MTRDDAAVRFVTGREIAAAEEDDVLDPEDFWRPAGGDDDV